MTSPGNSKFYDNWASGPVIIRSAKTNVTREEEIPEEDCRNWNCTCQGISNLYGIDHGRSFGNSPYFAKVFWRDKRCKTHPQYLPASEFSSGPPKVRAISNQHVIRQTRPQNADVNADTIDCSSWNCSCMGMSLRWHSNHFAKSYGLAPPIARDWWRRNRCHTTPIVKERPPHPKTEESKLAANSSVCYFFPTRLGTGRLEAIKQTWAKAVADRTYFIISENEDNETYVDWEKNEIHIAIRGYIDSEGNHVEGYNPEHIGRYGKIAVKMMKFWEYISSNYDEVWAGRCSWFVRSDDDTWLNTKLIDQRLACLDPDWEMSFGFTNNVWGIGIFTGYTRKLIRNFAYFLLTMRAWHGAEWMHADVDDRRLGQVIQSFGLGTIALVAHNGTDYFTNIDGHTQDWRMIEHMHNFTRALPPEFVGCMTFFHSARPPMMHTLTRTVELHLANGGIACPSGWRNRGMHSVFRDMISQRCPESS
eukprot:CAMPEP_0184488312 /NCGR_PEP_ID=MMETSP0113_2-20130426/11122_1 /TAXON_ID=91329 /ORGANISM="Norrisiella sphaerica, Strain BC52" /LENGTH=475 /DNA_ID=CAMNT_0026870919 /DNA_START=291 /DNA_END=1718 /DNA_ORIENTATION=+